MPRMSALDRRSALVDAALAVAERDGVAAATTRAVVAEAGMPLASFHYAVESREELLRDVIDLVVQREGEAIDLEGVFAQPTLEGAVRAAFSNYLRLVQQHPGLEQAMFELTQHALRSDSLQDIPATQYRSYWGLAEQLLDAVAAQYRVSWDRPTASLARLVVALTDGITLAWLADRDDAGAEDALGLAASAVLAHARPEVP